MYSAGPAVDGLVDLFNAMAIALCIFVLLGIWKLVEILIWCWNNINISIG